MIFISVTSDATTAMVTTFLLSSFDDVWAFEMFELVFLAMVVDSFVLPVAVNEFSVYGLFERVLLVDAEVWYVLSFPDPVTGALVDGENRIIGS